MMFTLTDNTRQPPWQAARFPILATCYICGLLLFGPASAQGIEIYPAQVNLAAGDMQQLVVSSAASGDQTSAASYQVNDDLVAEVSATGLLKGLAPGQTTVTIVAGNEQQRIELVVTEAVNERSFRYDVLPILSTQGCNSGGCHGKAGGQRGFKLSLFEEYPDADFRALVIEARGRRIFPSAPDQSLLLRKATGDLTHGGGVRFQQGSEEYRIIVEWIAAGMQPPAKSDARLVRLEWYPTESILPAGATQQLAITAHFDNGSRRDVTRQVVYDVNEPDIASVTADGLVQVQQTGGLATIVFRYGTDTGGLQVAVPFQRSDEELNELSQQHDELARDFEQRPIDQLLLRQWQRMAIAPSPLADDASYLRRVTLDICGSLPTPNEVRSFVDDQRPDKRAQLVDSLLNRPAYANYFAVKWADLLQNRGRGYSTRLQRPGTSLFYGWIRDSLASNKSYDQFVREIITATGSQAENAPAVWFRSVRTLPNYVESIAQAFLGVRIQCAQCHHHPNDRWTQGDYFGLAAVFARVGRKGGFADAEVPTSEVIYLKDEGDVLHPKTGRRLAPRPLGGPDFDLGPFADPRHSLADWMTAADNPFFARSIVNRMWSHFMGRGLVDPIDDSRSTNPASHPELLELLCSRFIEDGYDVKQLIRNICNSHAYQLEAGPQPLNQGDRITFARFYPRRLSAEVLLDGVSQVLGVATEFAGGPGKFPIGTRAIELPDENVPMHFLDVFGRPSRTKSCECERPSEATLGQALELVNSAEIQRKLVADDGYIASLAAQDGAIDDQVTEVFLRVLARLPSESERSLASGFLEGEPERRAALQSLTWSLLATNEFLFNH
jgi:hypothetical protein